VGGDVFRGQLQLILDGVQMQSLLGECEFRARSGNSEIVYTIITL
jgi:hypothetical protein